MVERIPLHSRATSISRPGNENTRPCLNTGIYQVEETIGNLSRRLLESHLDCFDDGCGQGDEQQKHGQREDRLPQGTRSIAADEAADPERNDAGNDELEAPVRREELSVSE